MGFLSAEHVGFFFFVSYHFQWRELSVRVILFPEKFRLLTVSFFGCPLGRLRCVRASAKLETCKQTNFKQAYCLLGCRCPTTPSMHIMS